ncbi:hypothetical protein ACIQ8G_29310 [Streptomyces sp. NPDC094154]|uniref:hypothetical protein n=1 Tax=Streptomyces sp. NPDC094154 TaxID=3366059 RepID=UPI00382FE777
MAYGWRKDITVHELLDPLPALVTADPARGRARVARIQPLCERLVLHTDGKETNAARPRWWNALAGADPAALADLAATGLLSDRNGPNTILHGAREDLWRAWNGTADPVVATALRITLDTPLLQADAALLDRLARTIGPSTPDGVPQLLRIALSRADERQANRDSSSDGTRLADAQLVAELNAVAERVGAPQLTRLPEPSVTDESQPRRSAPIPAQSATAPTSPAAPSPAPSEPVGLIRVLRAWHLSPYEAGAPQHTLEQMRDLVGDGLLNLAGPDRQGSTPLLTSRRGSRSRPRPRHDRRRRRRPRPGSARLRTDTRHVAACRAAPDTRSLLTLEDDRGPALRLICWRTEYERSAYRLPPAVAADDRLRWRSMPTNQVGSAGVKAMRPLRERLVIRSWAVTA